MAADKIPTWFWKLAATAMITCTSTLIAVSWHVGQFMGISHEWNKTQDARIEHHMNKHDHEKDVAEGRHNVLRELSGEIVARLHLMEKRLDRNEEYMYPSHRGE